MYSKTFSIDTLRLDYAKEAEKIANTLRNTVLKQFKKRGVVVAMSGRYRQQCDCHLNKQKNTGKQMVPEALNFNS